MQEAKEQLTTTIDIFRKCGADGWAYRTRLKFPEKDGRFLPGRG